MSVQLKKKTSDFEKPLCQRFFSENNINTTLFYYTLRDIRYLVVHKEPLMPVSL